MTSSFTASKAGRIMACPASANLDLAIPNWVPPVEDRTKDNAANRGTAKHKMLEPIMDLTRREVLMMAKVLQYVGDLRLKRQFKVLVEQEFKATWLVDEPTTTADLVLYVQDEVHVLDYKWGMIPVELIDNEQMLFYAVCAARLAPRAKGVTLHLLQPRRDVYDSWFVPTVDLAAFMAQAQEAERKIKAKDLTFGPSHHCTFCPANPHTRGLKGRPLCPAMMQMLYPQIIDTDEILSL